MKINTVTILGAILLAFLFLARPAFAQDGSLNAYFFYGDGCPHCAKEEQFLREELQEEYPELRIHDYEIYYDFGNSLLLQRVVENLNVRLDGVPFLVIGDRHFIGYADDSTSEAIRQRVNECRASVCPDTTAAIVGITPSSIGTDPGKAQTEKTPMAPKEDQQEVLSEVAVGQESAPGEKKITLPLLGAVNASKFSLPLLTVIMGALDGFNPCAMWTLLFLISLLIGMKNRKRMWLLGSVFIVASASVYFMFMSAWLNLVLFLGFLVWVRILIGIFALLGGGYSLKDFFVNKAATCKVTYGQQRKMVLERLKNAALQNSLWLALGGIIILAFAVNMVELICSAGLPAIYTQVLTLSNLPSWQYYLYILLYIFFFMLDDLFVFFVAMTTLQMTGVTTKYARASRLIGGLVMLAIGLMLIFKPGWLMF